MTKFTKDSLIDRGFSYVKDTIFLSVSCQLWVRKETVENCDNTIDFVALLYWDPESRNVLAHRDYDLNYIEDIMDCYEVLEKQDKENKKSWREKLADILDKC